MPAAEREKGSLRYGAGAALALWYGPLLVPLFVGDVAASDGARATWMQTFVVLPGMLAKTWAHPGGMAPQMAVAGGVTLVVLVLVAVLWIRWPRLRGAVAFVTLAIASANAWILAGLYAM